MSEQRLWKTFFNKEFLGAHDLDDGRDIILTIKRIDQEEVIAVGGIKSSRPIVTFNEKAKRMIFNNTHCKTISKITGSRDVNDWLGIPVQIYAQEGSAYGEVTDMLRIRPTKPKIEKTTLTPSDTKKWAMAKDAYSRDGNLNAVLKRVNISKEHQALITGVSNDNS